tara:strand:- start:61 stop:216 length:156 start_codon:yes stop_codon:yes gene_type:complete
VVNGFHALKSQKPGHPVTGAKNYPIKILLKKHIGAVKTFRDIKKVDFFILN